MTARWCRIATRIDPPHECCIRDQDNRLAAAAPLPALGVAAQLRQPHGGGCGYHQRTKRLERLIRISSSCHLLADGESSGGGNAAVGAVLLILLAVGYFIPTIIAATRHVPNVGSVVAINLFLGWTAIGWIIALAMAFGSAPPRAVIPLGMQTVMCPRCNAEQNIPAGTPTFECWQCKYKYVAHQSPGPLERRRGKPTAPPALETINAKCHACQHVQAVPVSQAKYVCEQCGKKLIRKKLMS